MGKLRSFFLCLIICLIAAAPASASSQSLPLTPPEKLTFPKLSFKPPQAERLTLSNGVIFYLLEDQELPLVNINFIFKTGAYFDPPGKEGLAELTGTVMRTGGTELMTGTAVDEALEGSAVIINTATHIDSISINFSSLKDKLEKGVDILAQIIRQPVFAEDKLQLAKSLKLEELRRIVDDPQQFAFREFNRALYRGDPRGRLPSLSSVAKITGADLLQFHRQDFNPDNMMIAVTGDISKQAAIVLLEKYFGSWPKQGVAAAIPPPRDALKGLIYLLPKEVPQSVVITGTFAPAKTNDDFYPFEVLDFLLGSGGFRSHIFQEIRTNQGLAYSAGSFYRAKTDYGILGTYAFTKSSTTGKVLSLLRALTQEMIGKPVKPEELAWAKKSINNSFIFSFGSAEQIARQQMMLEFEKLPSDYLLKYQQNINKVGRDDLTRVAKRYLSTGKSITLLMGQEKDFDMPAANFGTVETIRSEND